MTNKQLREITLRARSEKDDLVRIICALINHFGGKVSINESEVTREALKLHVKHYPELKEFTFSTSPLQ